MRIVKTAEENEPADRPPDSTSDMPSAELEEEEANDPNSLASLLERVLQKVSQLPGALEALSSDPQLLHDLQEHEFLIYPITPPVSSSQDASIVHRRSIRSSSHRSNSDAQLSSDDEDLTESVDMTSELFGSEYEAELQAVESLQRGKSMNMVIPRGSSMLVAAHDLSTSPSYSMGMLSLSPGASSQDGDPVSASLVGEAVFSRTYKATDTRTQSPVCLKIIRNSKEYFDQGIDEIRILNYLKAAAGDLDDHHILKLLDSFYFKEHLILVTELLKANLYEVSRPEWRQRYFTLPRLRKIAVECLEALQFLHALGMVHCDLKPENILMQNFETCQVKLIDFGSASFVSDELTYYIQSRAYRAPEVILGLRYDDRIDLWSLGCILAELYTGRVLFEHNSIAALLSSMMGLLGPLPPAMVAASPQADKYFNKAMYLTDEDGRVVVPLQTSLWQVLDCGDAAFVSFLQTLLHLDPARRVSAAAALNHPWLQSNVYGISDFSCT
ncbi:hypothetical protein DYB30_001294 [Aphanomyces astaci]|uniref:Protein kinase domain-containing protein n=3 Tax=Aphanomyces astaci TaxID=112090 RepID=A0A397AVT6_APHAT|nr:hypothetical protein DYB36_001266 [Aphanomyces astaci]RHY56434.1 hypothetical protein DYB30_001294 [Aphanomyces astaci]RHY58133.1 hypothetical protein DYB34_003713 [Aphanomyces astaci]